MNKEIENILLPWCKEMVEKFNWLTIKYELSKKYGVYLVSFSPSSKIDDCNEFNVDAMKFEDELNAKYGSNAPLFCDEERNFTFTEDVEIIKAATPNLYVTVSNLVDIIEEQYIMTRKLFNTPQEYEYTYSQSESIVEKAA